MGTQRGSQWRRCPYCERERPALQGQMLPHRRWHSAEERMVDCAGTGMPGVRIEDPPPAAVKVPVPAVPGTAHGTSETAPSGS